MGSSVILPPQGQPGPMQPGEFKNASIPNVVTFALNDVHPPSPLYVQRDDIIVVSAATSLAEQILVGGRLLLPYTPIAGQPENLPSPIPIVGAAGGSNIIALSGQLNTTTFRSFNSIIIQPGEGFLLGLTAQANQAKFRGQTFVVATLRRANAGGLAPEYVLFADYITSNVEAVWPGGRVVQLSEGTGWSHSVQVANPVAGADWSLVMAAGQRAQVKSFSATFTAAAAVANRNINVVIDDGTNVVWQDDVTAAVTATQVVSVNGTQTNAPAGIVATTLFVVLPPNLWLEPTWRLRSSTANIQAADQWSNIWFAVEEMMDGF
jgi:hypothetical protein